VLAVGAVQQKEKSIAAGLRQKLAFRALEFRVK
jgi:hypothetical protein